jgi:hypothetical protein
MNAITKPQPHADAAATALSETGCPAVALEHYTVHLGTKPARVDRACPGQGSDWKASADGRLGARCAIDWK